MPRIWRTIRTARHAVLREAIGKSFGLDPDRIICGAGSDEILNFLGHAFLGAGDEAIMTEHSFLVYPIATMANGAKCVVVPEIDFTADVDAILAAVTPRTKIVLIANPNNPTGTYVPFDEVKRLQRGLPPHVLLVIDAAYAEYVSRNDYEAGIELVATTENTVMCRTFSKIHGLASLRVGWMYAPRTSSTRSTGSAARSTFRHLRCSRRSPRLQMRPYLEHARAHNEQWLQLVDRGGRQARAEGDAERREFHPDPLPAGEGPDRRRRRCVPDQARPRAARPEELQAAACAAPHRRYRGGEPAGGRGLARIRGRHK